MRSVAARDRYLGAMVALRALTKRVYRQRCLRERCLLYRPGARGVPAEALRRAHSLEFPHLVRRPICRSTLGMN